MPDHRHQSKSSINWDLNIDRFLTREEIRKLRRWALSRRTFLKDDRLGWTQWALIEIAANSGLRVAEIADLNCGDIVLREELSYVFVRNGKCGKSRQVRINRAFQTSMRDFLKWKRGRGEATDADTILLRSPRGQGKYTTRALQLAFKRCLKQAGVPVYHSIHHIRHTYASCLLVSSNNNLRLVQKQLGHSSITTTQVYADLFKREIEKAIENLY